MSNSFYNTTSFPATGSPATSASMRAELARIAAAFDKMPVLAGNANKLVLVNPSATGLTVLAAPSGDLVGTSATQTLTNKTFSLASNTLTGTLAEFNAALSDGSFATLAGAETLTNKTLTSPVIGTIVNTGTLTLPSSTDTLVGRATSDTLTNKTISGSSNTLSNIANASLTNSAITIGSNAVSLGGTLTTIAGLTLTSPTIAQITNSGTLTLPTSNDTLVGRATTDTLTNKTISGSSNTLSNIGNSSLTNSAVTIGSTSVSLGGTATTIDGLTSVTSTAFVGALTGAASSNVLKAGDTMTGNLTIANGTDSRVNLQVSGVTEGILTASATNVRLSSANAIPITIGTNGVTRLTFTGTGFITTGASEYVGIGQQAGTNNALRIARNLENGTSAYAVLNDGTFQSGVTTQGAGFRSVARTAAAAFTMASLHHYQAVQATLGAGSAITTQAGFVADSSLTSATNNYGFQGSIASGTGRFNLYMDGSASNFLSGALGIGTTTVSNYNLRITRALTGGVSAFNMQSEYVIQSDVTTAARTYDSNPSTVAASFALTDLVHYSARQNTIGAGSSIQVQTGFSAGSSLVGATSNYGFRGAIPAGTNRWNLYMDGTAANLLAGDTTFSAALTLNAGTANGVAYLNGSKVLTTGSALTFDGANFGVTGTSSTTTSSGQLVRISDSTGSSGYNSISLNGNDTFAGGMGLHGAAGGDTTLYYTVASGGNHQFRINNAEQMRLTSTGLGIGTSSPAYKLQVSGGDIALDNGRAINFRNGANTAFGNVLSVDSSNRVNFGDLTTSASAMVLSSGNLGLGVTPPASTSGSYIWNRGGCTISDGVGGAYYAGVQNAVFNSGWKYVSSGFAGQYIQVGGEHRFLSAPSGTAGNAISFTQALTLSAVGNLLLGGTSDPASAAKAIVIYNGTAPTGNIAGGTLYVEGGALKYRGSSGTVTTIANA